MIRERLHQLGLAIQYASQGQAGKMRYCLERMRYGWVRGEQKGNKFVWKGTDEHKGQRRVQIIEPGSRGKGGAGAAAKPAKEKPAQLPDIGDTKSGWVVTHIYPPVGEHTDVDMSTGVQRQISARPAIVLAEHPTKGVRELSAAEWSRVKAAATPKQKVTPASVQADIAALTGGKATREHLEQIAEKLGTLTGPEIDQLRREHQVKGGSKAKKAERARQLAEAIVGRVKEEVKDKPVPVKKPAGKKPPAPRKPAATDTSEQIKARVMDLYNTATQPTTTRVQIEEAALEWGSLSRKDLADLARQVGITETLPSKARTIKAIKDVILNRKGAHERARISDPPGPGIFGQDKKPPTPRKPAASKKPSGATSTSEDHPFAGMTREEKVQILAHGAHHTASPNPRGYDTDHFPAGIQGEKLTQDVQQAVRDAQAKSSFVRPNIRQVYDTVKSAHPGMTLHQFQTSLAKMMTDRQIRLDPFTDAKSKIPDPDAAIPLDKEVKYFVDLPPKPAATGTPK